MSEWTEFTLGNAPIEIIDGDRGKNYPKKTEFLDDGYCLFLNTKNVTLAGFAFDELNFIDRTKDSLLRKGRLKRGDLVLTTRGTVGNVAYYHANIPFDCIRINSGMVVIRPKGIDERFNYYLFRFLNSSFEIFATGSAQPQLPIRDLKNIPIALPPIVEQEAIAGILSSLDDKIDLLHRQNQTLEALAQTLFRHWFIDNPEDDWEEMRVKDFGEVICGKTPSKKIPQYFNGHIPFIKIPDMHGQIFVFETTDTLSELGRNSQLAKSIPPRSINVSCIATVGLVTMNAFESQTNQQINTIVPFKDYFRYFLYLMMTNLRDELNLMASGGTATLNLNTGDFSRMKIAFPPEHLLIEFHSQVETGFEKIFHNQLQIRTLEKLRDMLLPKLMSGEVRVLFSAPEQT